MGALCPSFACCCFNDCCSENNKVNPEPSPNHVVRRAQVESENQLTAFQMSDQSTRRYSHPNQLKGLEEYENAKKGISNPSTPPADNQSPPTSPFMVWPVIPPGRLM